MVNTKSGIAYQLSRRLLPLSVGIWLLLTILAPATYWLLEHRNLKHITQLYAEELAAKFQRFALDSPGLWKYQTYKFLALKEGFHPSIDVSGFNILDEKGGPIAGYTYKSAWKRPAMKLVFMEYLLVTRETAPVLFNNRRVGTVEVFVSNRRLLLTVTAIFCLSSLIAITLAFLSYRFPVRVVQKAEKEILRLNEELELKVQERTKQLLDAQEELVRKEKLATLGQLAGSVGHELRNPLGVMSNAVYYLKAVMSGSDETVKEYLNIIKSEIDNSQRIITDLLDFSRTRTPQPGSISVDELIDQGRGKCVFPENVMVQVNIPETLPLLKVDPFQMSQVFHNLITNAVQAMPEGGALRISARAGVRGLGLGIGGENLNPNPQSPTPDGDFIEISVTDTGEGISQENMKKLFQPLFTTKAKGIGLGLVVCKNLVEANGGKLDVESRLGEGATFTVILPAAGKRQ